MSKTKDNITIRVHYRAVVDTTFNLKDGGDGYIGEVNRIAVRFVMAIWFFEDEEETPEFVKRLVTAARRLIYRDAKVPPSAMNSEKPVYTKGIFVCYSAYKVSTRRLAESFIKLSNNGNTQAKSIISACNEWFDSVVLPVLAEANPNPLTKKMIRPKGGLFK